MLKPLMVMLPLLPPQFVGFVGVTPDITGLGVSETVSVTTESQPFAAVNVDK